jgi:hypothetical protein
MRMIAPAENYRREIRFSVVASDSTAEPSREFIAAAVAVLRAAQRKRKAQAGNESLPSQQSPSHRDNVAVAMVESLATSYED